MLRCLAVAARRLLLAAAVSRRALPVSLPFGRMPACSWADRPRTTHLAARPSVSRPSLLPLMGALGGQHRSQARDRRGRVGGLDGEGGGGLDKHCRREQGTQVCPQGGYKQMKPYYRCKKHSLTTLRGYPTRVLNLGSVFLFLVASTSYVMYSLAHVLMSVASSRRRVVASSRPRVMNRERRRVSGGSRPQSPASPQSRPRRPAPLPPPHRLRAAHTSDRALSLVVAQSPMYRLDSLRGVCVSRV